MSHRRVRIWPPLAEEWLNMRFGASFWPWGWQWVDDGEEFAGATLGAGAGGSPAAAVRQARRMSSRLIDLTGQDIAGWHVLSRAANSQTGMACWWCRCRGCGLVARVHGGNLRAGTSRQCVGCRGRMQRRRRYPVGSAAE